MNYKYTAEPKQGHWEVKKDGNFYCTADTKEEAMREIRDLEKEEE